MGKDNITTEMTINNIFANKFSDYRELMKIAGCSEEDIDSKYSLALDFKDKNVFEKASIIVDDIAFLNYFTNGIVLSDNNDKALYQGINQEIAHSLACDISSITNRGILPREYQNEIDSDQVKLIEIKDKVNYDICEMIPETKKMFFNGEAEEFHKRMIKIYNDSDKIQQLSDIVDESVLGKGFSKDSMKKYDEIIKEGKKNAKEINFNPKSISL